MDLFNEMVTWRRHLHQYPDLSYEEYDTTDYIIQQLDSLPHVEIFHGKELVGTSTGLIAVIGDGTKRGIGLRADIDALPIVEDHICDYRSKHNGIMHACGHDGHTAMLIGAIHKLSALFQNGQLTGNVTCVFQPAEEATDDNGRTGAEYMVESSLIKQIDMIMALHIDPTLPLGQVKLTTGPVMANVDTFSIIIHSKGGHGGYPEQTNDPIWLLSFVLPALYSMPGRRFSPLEPAVCSIGQITAGTSPNVIPSQVKLEGTCRTYSEEARACMEQHLQQICDSLSPHGGVAQLHYMKGEPLLNNDEDVVREIKNSVQQINPHVAIHQIPYGMGGEDFSHFTNRMKGAFLFIGAKKEGHIDTTLHHPSFDFDEKALVFGMNTLVQFVINQLRSDNNGT
ncbi:M20 family metallopeptidase [Halalkalibacter sp. AB-rgal2]|uniref:M20 metallopeptidase family protein n=1 Tax=Halalkalibacter sp. AB-rgal2 TaxID=3242695 RepID=UPI00359D0119